MALADNALTIVATVEDELGIASGTEDARLERYINEASAIAESYAGRSFYRETVTENVRGGEGPYLFIAKPPIVTLGSISFLGSAISSADYEIHNADAGIIYAINGSWQRLSVGYQDISRTPASGQERKAYEVFYSGGWITPNQVGTRDLPYDIEAAAIMIVSHLYRSRGRDQSIRSESLLQSSVTYGGNAATGAASNNWLRSAIPGAAAILDRYKTAILR